MKDFLEFLNESSVYDNADRDVSHHVGSDMETNTHYGSHERGESLAMHHANEVRQQLEDRDYKKVSDKGHETVHELHDNDDKTKHCVTVTNTGGNVNIKSKNHAM